MAHSIALHNGEQAMPRGRQPDGEPLSSANGPTCQTSALARRGCRAGRIARPNMPPGSMRCLNARRSNKLAFRHRPLLRRGDHRPKAQKLLLDPPTIM